MKTASAKLSCAGVCLTGGTRAAAVGIGRLDAESHQQDGLKPSNSSIRTAP